MDVDAAPAHSAATTLSSSSRQAAWRQRIAEASYGVPIKGQAPIGAGQCPNATQGDLRDPFEGLALKFRRLLQAGTGAISAGLLGSAPPLAHQSPRPRRGPCARRQPAHENGACRAATRVAPDRSRNGGSGKPTRSPCSSVAARQQMISAINGRIIPSRVNLQEISREIADGLKA
jgi:hypothetical protein